MRFASTVRASAVVLLSMSAAAGVARAADTPGSAASAADVQKLVDDQNYAGAVSAASRLLAASGAAAASVDKGQLYAIKGEAQLHLKQYAQASDAFDKASKAAGDPPTAAMDSALSTLAKRVRNGTYTPKHAGADGAKATPLDVMTADGRKAALSALFDDELAAAEPKLKAAQTAKSMPQLLAAATLANSLRSLEVAATGADEKSKPEVAAVADHAHGLLETALQTASQRVSDISKAANMQNPTYGRYSNGATGTVPRMQKVGLTSRNVSELKDIQSTCQQVGPAADAFAKAVAEGTPTAPATDPPAAGGTAAAAAGGGTSDWNAVSAEATKVSSEAQDVLSADYGNGTGNGTGANATNGGGTARTGTGRR